MRFGLYDPPHPEKGKAYINEIDEDNWIAIVNNPSKHPIDFYAIDHCTEIKRLDGKEAKRCDGLLKYKNAITFVELKERKDRKGNKWLKEAVLQLKETYSYFCKSNNISDFENINAYVCNNKKPNFRDGHTEQKERFKTETGIRLFVQQEITI